MSASAVTSPYCRRCLFRGRAQYAEDLEDGIDFLRAEGYGRPQVLDSESGLANYATLHSLDPQI